MLYTTLQCMTWINAVKIVKTIRMVENLIHYTHIKFIYSFRVIITHKLFLYVQLIRFYDI